MNIVIQLSVNKVGKRKSDVAHQKVHKQGRDDIRVKVNIQSLIHLYIFSQQDRKAKKENCKCRTLWGELERAKPQQHFWLLHQSYYQVRAYKLCTSAGKSDDKYTISYSTVKESQPPSAFCKQPGLSSQLAALLQ